ncbi:Protein CBG27913 [Caenorhabditis briggsae]|uniref:Uncharacterized protein n=2 Tax=Caenorhabditis briggsae TaxID=6238 RepID=A0AAE8ZS42_CAEBR|nr:Protein CBG27913 [Caenorhabditis briggsae]ULT83657.1 hypothetical protein L3Y34_012718 [Caenorhabditis briggsae]UMM42918.1 hypothetical protein L5515_018573 [Caenorhabditis briggsae]CAR98338.1 Protein CBG27913 [Caenorhabditis briggsae]
MLTFAPTSYRVKSNTGHEIFDLTPAAFFLNSQFVDLYGNPQNRNTIVHVDVKEGLLRIVVRWSQMTAANASANTRELTPAQIQFFAYIENAELYELFGVALRIRNQSLIVAVQREKERRRREIEPLFYGPLAHYIRN